MIFHPQEAEYQESKHSKIANLVQKVNFLRRHGRLGKGMVPLHNRVTRVLIFWADSYIFVPNR
jgi:hypothetical protein